MACRDGLHHAWHGSAPLRHMCFRSLESTAPIHAVGVAADPPAIGVATLNAAVVALFIASVVAYAVLVAHRIHDLTDGVLESVREINQFSDAVRYIAAKDGEFLQSFDQDTMEGRYDLVREIEWVGAMRYPPGEREPGRRTESNTLSAEDAAGITISIMSFLTGRYPFPGRFRFGSSEPVIAYDMIGQPVEIDDLEDANRWIARMNELNMWVSQSVGDRAGTLRDLFEEESRPRREERAKLPFTYSGPGAAADREAFSAQFDHLDLVDKFLSAFQRGREIADRSRYKLAELENYRKARMPRGRLRLAIVACAVATVVFLAGVVLPLVNTHAPRWAVIWLPVSIYLLCVPVGFYCLARLYKTAPKKPTG